MWGNAYLKKGDKAKAEADFSKAKALGFKDIDKVIASRPMLAFFLHNWFPTPGTTRTCCKDSGPSPEPTLAR